MLNRHGRTLVWNIDFSVAVRSLSARRSGESFNPSDSALRYRHDWRPGVCCQGSRWHCWHRDVEVRIAETGHLGRCVHGKKAPPVVVLLQGDVELEIHGMEQFSLAVVDVPQSIARQRRPCPTRVRVVVQEFVAQHEACCAHAVTLRLINDVTDDQLQLQVGTSLVEVKQRNDDHRLRDRCRRDQSLYVVSEG